MIGVKLFGGCGNQIFQYVYALVKAKELNTELFLDTSVLLDTPAGWTKYNYELGIFKGVTEPIINNSGLPIVNEGQEVFNNCLLDGYFQDDIYFDDIEEEVRARLQFKNPEEFSFVRNQCFIHARRGDYLNGDHFVDLSKTNYYQDAVKYMKEKYPGILFNVVTNDVPWAREFFKFVKHPLFRNNTMAQDLQLMSQSGHAITANSTFSWWGSYLISDSPKTVIQPNRWLRDRLIGDLKQKGSILL